MNQQKTSKKKDRQRNKEAKVKQNMISFLETKWQNTINYTCYACLQEAYNSEMNDCQGYVTDEELIKSSKHKLKQK